MVNNWSRTVMGAYDDDSIYPTGNNWTRHSRFKIDNLLQTKREIPIPYTIKYYSGSDKFVIDRIGNILIAVSDNNLLNPEFGKVIKIDNEGKFEDLFTTNNHLRPPVIGKDQNIYVAEAYCFNKDSLSLYCINSNGQLLWDKRFLCDEISSIPVLDQFGNVYIVTGKEQSNKPTIYTLHSLSSQGVEKWNWSHLRSNVCEPKIGKDGSVYYNILYKLIKFTIGGNVEWEKDFSTFIGPLLIDSNGDICFESDGYIIKINENGQEVHRIEVNTLAEGSLPLDTSNLSYICEVYRCKLIAVDTMSNILWEYQSKGFQVDIYPIIDSADNIIFCVTGSGYEPKSYINIISKNGKLLWEYEIGGAVISIVIGGDNVMHVLCRVPIKKTKKKDAFPAAFKILTLSS